MTILGADVDGLDGLAAQMLSAGERLDLTRATVRSLLSSVPWNGEDAAGFKSDWEGAHSARLDAVVGAIRTAAHTLKRNAAEQRQASQAVIQSKSDHIATDTDTRKFEAGGTIRYVKLGVDGQIVETRYADKHYEVTVSGGGEIGAGLKEKNVGGSITANDEASRTYTFASKSAADKFVQGLMDAATPKVDLNPLTNPFVFVPGSLVLGSAIKSGGDVASYLDGYSAISTKVSGSLNQDVSVGVPEAGKVSLHQGAKAEYDLQSGETTASLEVKGEGIGNLGPYQGAVGAGGTMEVAWKGDGHIESLTFKGNFSAQDGVGAPGPIEVSDLAGLQGSFQMKIDLADPANRSLAMDLLAKTSSGDIQGAAHDFAQLRDSSEIVLQANTMTKTSGGFDVDVANAKVSDVKVQNIATWVKPANGDFARLHE
jgi:hypothetical protein